MKRKLKRRNKVKLSKLFGDVAYLKKNRIGLQLTAYYGSLSRVRNFRNRDIRKLRKFTGYHFTRKDLNPRQVFFSVEREND